MPAGGKKKLKGRIVVVQEDRFRMVEETGRGFLFTVSHKAGIEHEDLRRYMGAGVSVEVAYEGEPNLASGVAHSLEPVES